MAHCNVVLLSTEYMYIIVCRWQARRSDRRALYVSYNTTERFEMEKSPLQPN
jgi:hypothetical protein